MDKDLDAALLKLQAGVELLIAENRRLKKQLAFAVELIEQYDRAAQEGINLASQAIKGEQIVRTTIKVNPEKWGIE